jgi:hypothetical protein
MCVEEWPGACKVHVPGLARLLPGRCRQAAFATVDRFVTAKQLRTRLTITKKKSGRIVQTFVLSLQRSSALHSLLLRIGFY